MTPNSVTGLEDRDAGRRTGIVAAIGQHDGQQLPEGEGHDDEMMAADPQRRDADDGREGRSGEAGDRQRGPESDVEIAQQDRRRVGADADEGGMPHR